MAENKNLDTQEKETKQYIVVRIGGEGFLKHRCTLKE